MPVGAPIAKVFESFHEAVGKSLGVPDIGEASLETPQGVFPVDPDPPAEAAPERSPAGTGEGMDPFLQPVMYAALFQAGLCLGKVLEPAEANPAGIPTRGPKNTPVSQGDRRVFTRILSRVSRTDPSAVIFG